MTVVRAKGNVALVEPPAARREASPRSAPIRSSPPGRGPRFGTRAAVAFLAARFVACGGGEAGTDGGSDVPPDADAPCTADRLRVRPVLYLAADASLAPEDESAATALLVRHLDLARNHYREMLVADTFCAEQPTTYRSTRAATAYDEAVAPDSAHLMAASLLDAAGEDRNVSRHVFVVVFVRPAALPCGGATGCLGGGRTFNGYPGAGGGIVQMEYSSLLGDDPYPFQSTLVHEIGHAFGLVHSDCYGEDLATGTSIMSYNPAHWSSGPERSATPGTLLPEEYFLLDAHDLAFPDFTWEAARHNPTGRALVGVDGTCEIPAMDGAIGPMARAGYELFFDAARVSGPDAQFYTRGQARDSCAWNIANQPAGIAILCLFDGATIGSR